MKTIRAFSTALAFAIGLLGMNAYASAAEPAKTETLKNVQLGGKVIVKSEMKDGKTAKQFSLEVSSAKGQDDKEIADLKGKTILLTGEKASQLDKDANQHALVRGTLAADQTSLDVESFTGHTTPKKANATPKKKAPSAPTGTHASPQTGFDHSSPLHKN